MHLQILGGHQVESAEGRATAFLIDGTIAIDAGGLTGGLTLAGVAVVLVAGERRRPAEVVAS